MSINHLFNKGSMYNRSGDGLRYRNFEGKENIYNQSISAEMFLCKQLFDERGQYTHFLYTEQVTPSDPIN